MTKWLHEVRGRLQEIPAVSAWRLLVWYGALGALLVVVLMPLGRYARKLDGEVADLTAQVREQEMYYPLYKQLSDVAGMRLPGQATATGRGPLSKDAVADIPALLGTIASTCGVECLSAVPRADSLSGGNLLQVEAVFAGELSGLRRALLEVTGLSCLDRIDEMDVSTAAGKRELRLSLWLAVDVNGPSS